MDAYTELFTSEIVLGSWEARPSAVLFFGMNSTKTPKYLFPLPLKATTNTGRNKSP